MLTGGGCSMDQEQRIALLENAVTAAQAKVEQADGQIAFLQQQLSLARAAWDNPALPADQRAGVQGTIDLLSGALTQAVDYRQVVAAVLAETKASVEEAKANPSPTAEMDIASTIIRAVTNAIGPQAAAWGTIVTLVLSILAAALQRQKATAATEEADAAHTDACNAIDEAGEARKELEVVKATGTVIVKAVETLPDNQKKAIKAAVGAQMKDVAAKTPDLTYDRLNAVVDQLKGA
jgi:hypothetical protein